MFRRFCRCAFLIIGAFMVLLAIVLALSIELDATQAQARQVERAYVAQAVSQLESGCLTCHDLVNMAPQVEGAAQFAAQIPEISSNTATETTTIFLPVQDQLKTQLIKTGHRILDLPQVQNERFDTAVEEYLHVYAQTGAVSEEPLSESVTQWTLQQLDEIDALLNSLEHQASPYQLVRRDNQPDSASPAALQALQTLTPVPSVAMLVETVSLGDGGQNQFAHLDIAQLAMPQEIVYATHRRGPPAGMALESVL